MIPIGYVRFIYDQDYDPSDPTFGYTPYEFFPVNGQMGMDWQRRESIQVIPGADSVLDGNGRTPGPQDRRDFPYTFRLHISDGDLDAAYDKLAAVVAPGYPVRLVYTTDANIKAGGTTYWYTTAYNASIRHTRTSASYYGGRGDVDFVVTWRIRPDWRLRYSETADRFSTAPVTFAVDHHETFGSRGTTTIASAVQFFTVDARGTAGVDLPTIPDTGPTVTISGPAGGDGGILVANTSVTVLDTAGVRQPQQFTLPFNLPTAADSVTLNFAKQSFLHTSVVAGIPTTVSFRPTKPNYQTGYFSIKNGIQNVCEINAQGANPLTGGHVTVDFWRKRA